MLTRLFKVIVTLLYLFTAFCVLSSLFACQSEPKDPIDVVLDKAEENKKELQKVRDHYTRQGDTLKYRAAEFLIQHLDAQFIVRSDRIPEQLNLLEQLDHLDQVQSNRTFDSLETARPTSNTGRRIEVIQDYNIITAEFLIDNIDQAFDAWQTAPWKDQVNFQTFCNYILPYKSGNAELQQWRHMYVDTLIPIVDTILQTDSLMQIVNTLLAKRRPGFRFIHNMNNPGDFGAYDLLTLEAGQCYEWAHTTNYMMRAFAIPSVLIYAPRWATHPAGHAWNGILDSSGNIYPIAIEYNVPYKFNPMHWPLKTGKLYMLPYEKNETSFAMRASQRTDQDIPAEFRDPRMVDITAKFIPVIDLPVGLKHPSPGLTDAVFLCVFNRGTPNAIGWAEVANNNTVYSDVGKDVIYLPAWYQKGKYHAAADPMMVTYDGEIFVLTPDTTAKITARLYRKFPIRGSMFRYTEPFMGMKIQISEDSGFTKTVDKHIINRYPSPVIPDWIRQRDRWRWEEYRDSIVFTPPLKTQYLRFHAAPAKECIVGDIECLDIQGQPVSGQAYGSKAGAENVLDGLYGECYHDPDSLGWVAIDFGKNVTISKIRYLPCHDSNSIQVGERYELMYWDRQWISLGEQVATRKYLDYEMPSNALFWLRNLDTGVEERIFTIDERGEQMWW